MTTEPFQDWTGEPPEIAPGVRLHELRARSMVFARIRLAPGTELNAHAHPEEQLFLVLSGTLRYRVGEIERVAGPGTLIYVPPDVRHWGRVEGTSDLEFVEAKQLSSATGRPQ